MNVNSRGRYALMAVVAIAGNSEGRPLSLGEISQRQGISLSYLEQIFSRLRRRGIVKSVRGPGGGYLLARQSSELPVADIVAAVEHPAAVDRAGDTPALPAGAPGMEDPTMAFWSELDQHIGRFLGAISVADICANRARDVAARFGPGTGKIEAAAE